MMQFFSNQAFQCCFRRMQGQLFQMLQRSNQQVQNCLPRFNQNHKSNEPVIDPRAVHNTSITQSCNVLFVCWSGQLRRIPFTWEEFWLFETRKSLQFVFIKTAFDKLTKGPKAFLTVDSYCRETKRRGWFNEFFTFLICTFNIAQNVVFLKKICFWNTCFKLIFIELKFNVLLLINAYARLR